MRVIGTAGHVDHGKSTLVRALTGINPDRLKEEQQREMTIELGFAWMTLPGGEEVGIVDVPGHRDFIENMLSGIGGIDAVVFVVAADEGVMPQTREHLHILDILRIPTGIVALTKTDLVNDPEWLEMVEEDLRQVFAGTVLEEAPILRVSARHQKGLGALVTALEGCLQEAPLRANIGRPRLAVDRVFSIAGFGTVVTGTLLDGILRVGDEVEMLPSGVRGRVRGLQTHKKKEDLALPGSRTAVNISGVTLDELARGDVLAKPGDYKPTRRIDVHFRMLKDAGISIQHNVEAKVFLGASETSARIRLLGADVLAPGEEGWLQLELEKPLVAVRGDHYILRRPSPGETLGGGEVVDPAPRRRHKRFSTDVIERLIQMMRGTPTDLLLQAVMQTGPEEKGEVIKKSRLNDEDFREALDELTGDGRLVQLTGQASNQPDVILTSNHLEENQLKLENLLKQYHQRQPLRVGIPREELKSRLKFSARVFNTLMQYWLDQHIIEESNSLVCLAGHRIRFSAEQQIRIDQLFEQFSKAPFSPPTVKEIEALVGEEVLDALVALNEFVRLNQEVVFRTCDYQRLVEDITKRLEKGGTITVAQFRDTYQSSRRYALAFLEHLDQMGLTMRVGDERKLRKR